MGTTIKLLLVRHETEGQARAGTDDVTSWAGSSDNDVTLFFDDIGSKLAMGYHARELTYEFCDLFVNDLSGVLNQWPFSDTKASWPQLLYDVYDPLTLANVIDVATAATIQWRNLLILR